jgi:hypothetical protein
MSSIGFEMLVSCLSIPKFASYSGILSVDFNLRPDILYLD